MKLLANLLISSIFGGICPNTAQLSQIAPEESDFALSQVIEPERVTSVSQLVRCSLQIGKTWQYILFLSVTVLRDI